MKKIFAQLLFTLAISTTFSACLFKVEPKRQNANEEKKETTPPDLFKHGEELIRYPNGVIKIRGEYVSGKRVGEWRAWYLNGQPWSMDWYEDGKKNGKTASWYENGKPRYEGLYYNDLKSGKWVFYDSTGKIIKEENFD